MRRRIAAITHLAASLALVSSVFAQGPDMSSFWPNHDGASWHYEQHYQTFFPDQAIVDNEVRLVLDGPAVAPVGIEAQYLREEVLGGTPLLSTRVAPVRDRFLQMLCVARPDLRDRVIRAVEGQACPTGGAPEGYYSLLLSGELAYRKSVDDIAAWRCDLANTRAWLWLVSDLTVGNTFTLQLVPDLSSDVFLHGTIATFESVTIPAGTFSNCLRVDYRVDYGLFECRDEQGNPGTFRAETRGSVHYAPGVGPVQCSEEFVYVEATGNCIDPSDVGRPSSVVTLRLVAGPVAVRPVTWGGLKARYR
jgi:hypothetical protein